MQRKAEAVKRKAASLRQQQTGKSLRAAIPLLQKSVRLFSIGHAYSSIAESYIEIGEIYWILGDYHKSLIYYQKSLNFTEEHTARHCRTLGRMTQVYANIGRVKQATDSLKKTLAACDKITDKSALAEMFLAQGEFFYYSETPPQNATEPAQPIESYYARAQELLAESGDKDREAWALLHLAYVLSETNWKEALKATEHAMQIWSSLKNRQGVAQARQALGVFAAMQGQFETALCNSAYASKIFHDLTDRGNEGIVLNNLGRVSREIGEPQTSLEHYRRAKTLLAAVHDLLAEIEAMHGMGAALTALQRYQPLLSLYQRSLHLAERAKSQVLIASATSNMADVYGLKHQYARAETLYRRAAALFGPKDRPRLASDVWLSLASLQAEQHHDAEAISTLELARPLKVDTGGIEGLARIDYELAFIYRRMGRLEDALAAIEQTINIIESQRLRIASFDSRAAYFAAVHRYHSLYIQILMALDKQHPQQGFAQKAFEASEKSKVRSLLDLLTVSNQNSPCDELLNKPLDIDSAAVKDENRKDGSATASSTLDLKQVQAEIRDDILLEYALGDESSYVWLVDQNQIFSYELPQSEHLRKLVKSFLGGMAPLQSRQGETASQYDERVRAADRDYNLHAKELSQLLVGQVSLPAEKRVLIVPDGFLQYIPFSALPLPQAGERNAVLLTHHEVVVLPSVSALAAVRTGTEKRAPPTLGVAILADPVFEQPSVGVASDRKPAAQRSRDRSPDLNRALRDVHGSQNIPSLPGSRDEAMSIRKVFGAQDVLLALKYDASREAVLNGLLSHYRVVHIATHGMIDVRHPELSGLILSLVNRQGRPQDGYLRLGDIYNLKLSADLVVLSACDSALGKELESEGIIGLPRGFLYAGAKSVIASLWRVDDNATAALMLHLYTRIKQGQTLGAALRGAQLDMARDRRYSKPAYWAAFVLQGDYKYPIAFKTGL